MDEADAADREIEAWRELAIRQTRAAPALRPNGKCHFCQECVIGKLLFCDADCAQDFEAEEEQLRRAGRRV
jgi:hypothetical protein